MSGVQNDLVFKLRYEFLHFFIAAREFFMLNFINLKDLLNTFGLFLKSGGNKDDSSDLGWQTNSLYSFVLNLLIYFVGLVQSRLFQV